MRIGSTRTLALLAAATLTTGLGLGAPSALAAPAAPVTPASAAATATVSATPSIVGSLGHCTKKSGALVAVTFAHWNGPIVRGCDPTPTTGITLLTKAGFTTTGTRHDGPAVICRIGHPLFSNGTQRPTTTEDKCNVTPPSSRYWSYWLALAGQNTWTFSPFGAFSDHPHNGEVEAWAYGSTQSGGTSGRPAFTPNQIRAGLPTGSAPLQATVQLNPASSVDLGQAVAYLTANLAGGTHYEPFGGGFADFGLTMDGAFALAATGTDDAALKAIVDFLDQRGNDGSGRNIDDYTGIGTEFASGGSVGKEALTAEIAGYDPRSFGGHDLIAALDGLVCTTADGTVCAGAGNYRYAQSTFSQALAVLAQLRAGDNDGAAQPIAYLEGLQHSSGAFPSVLPGTGSDTDSTAMAAMALALVPTDRARTAVGRALAWLAAQQESDGSFPGAAGESVNSAAVSTQALHLAASTYASAITAGEQFLASEQNSDGGFNVTVGAESAGSDVRASTQAVGAIAGMPFGSVLDDVKAKAAADDGADYLVAQLTGGDHFTSSFGGTTFDDQGLTADGLFGLLAAGGHASTVAAMTAYLRGQVDAYADVSGAFGGPFSGSLAKLALVAEATGGNPHAFGGFDLLKTLADHVCTAATTDGTCTAAGDFVSSFSGISQALGVLALQGSPVAGDHLTPASPPVARLHALQCADGGFSSVLLAAGDACTSDVDATGFAVQALIAVPGTSHWLAAAQHYLATVQKSSGLYPGAAGDNSNSTALAADGLESLTSALADTGADPDGVRALAPIESWQSALHGLTTLAVAGGGFGITTNDTADLRSTTQAVQGATQQTLLALSGAAVVSAPGTAGSGPTNPPTSPAAGGSSASSSGANPDDLANTGAATAPQLGWALALLFVGAAFCFAGRRRIALAVGRHRSVPRHR